MISIIICTFNRRYLLEKMLKSILAQNFDEYEIIIVNDCSNDDTLEYLSNFTNHKNFKIINNKINLGLVSSRIIGIRYAKFEYVIQLDDDDEMYPNCLIKYSSILKKYKFDFLISDHTINATKIKDKDDDYSLIHYDNFYNLPDNKIHPKAIWAHIIKTKIAKLVYDNLDLKQNYGEDLIFLSKIYKISDNFGYANFNSINYSKKADSMTNLTKMNYTGILEYCNCHCYIPHVWGKNTFPTNIMNLSLLNFRYFCFKIFENQLSEYQLNQMKKKFIKCYEGFDFELMQKIATKKYQKSKKFYNSINNKFLYYINE